MGLFTELPILRNPGKWASGVPSSRKLGGMKRAEAVLGKSAHSRALLG